MGDESGRGFRYVSLAAVPGVVVYLMEAAVSGEWVVQVRHAAMETACFCTSANHCVAPEQGGKSRRVRPHSQRLADKQTDKVWICVLPVVSSAAQAAVVAGLAVDAAWFAPYRGSRAMMSSDGLVKVV